MFGIKQFDIVIGNPPYVRVQNLPHYLIDMYKETYRTAWKRIDVSTLFIELAYNLINEGRIVSLITSNQFITTEYGKLMRTFLLTNKSINKMIDFGDLPLFENALTYVSIFFLSKLHNSEFLYNKVKTLPFLSPENYTAISIQNLSDKVWTLGDTDGINVIDKLLVNSERLDAFAKCWAGIFTDKDEIFLYDINDQIDFIENNLLMPVLRAQDCYRYKLSQPSKKAFYPYKELLGKTTLLTLEELKKNYPLASEFILKKSLLLKNRKDSRKLFGEKQGWYGLIRFGKLSRFRQPKIISPGEVKHNKFSLDLTGSAFSWARVFSITSESEELNIYYLLGILNSKLAEYYCHSKASLKQIGTDCPHSSSNSSVANFTSSYSRKLTLNS